jgi:RNA polymerase sigma-70 factor (ECF subfamily)
MSPKPLDTLLQKLTSGDAAAAEQVFRTYEPYLRIVVRRRLSAEMRTKFDSIDIVQSVWLHMFKRFREAGCTFVDVDHLRAFLVQLTRHRLIDRVRRHRLAIESERSLEGTGVEDAAISKSPQPLENLQTDELWEQLLELCPPAHVDILHLKRDGALTGEVAARTGLNEGSIRRILNTLSKRLARRRGENDL